MGRVRAQRQTRLGAGGYVDGVAELGQSLAIVLTTPIGSVPGRPRFGSRLHELIDADLPDVKALGPRYAREAILESLPRISFVDASSILLGPTQVETTIRWRPASSRAIQMTRVVTS
jgi:uncharacterized protein